MADTADFKTMYAMLKVHSANQAKEIERLQERLATPPADAALADAIKLACNYYRQAGRVGTTSQTLAKQHEAAADKIIAEALRVRAVMDIDGERYRLLRTFNWNDSPICCVADPKASVRLGCDCPSGDRLDEKLDAMLAASKAGEGK